MSRISRVEYFFKVVEAISLRSTCDRGRAGAIVVKNNRVISSGYCGSPPGMPHCDDEGHVMELKVLVGKDQDSTHCVRTIHAEANALMQSARYGPPLNGSEMYCSMVPCKECAKMIVAAGVVAVHAQYDYQNSKPSKNLLKKAKVNLTVEKEGELSYDPK